MVDQNSKRYSFSKDDLFAIAKGAGLAAGGVLVTYLAGVVADWDNTTTLGAMFSAFASIVLNVARKYLADHSDK